MLWLCGVFKTLLCLASHPALHGKISSTSCIWGVLVYLASGESDWETCLKTGCTEIRQILNSISHM